MDCKVIVGYSDHFMKRSVVCILSFHGACLVFQSIFAQPLKGQPKCDDVYLYESSVMKGSFACPLIVSIHILEGFFY